MASKRDQQPAASTPAKSERELLGMVPGSGLYDANGELNEAAIDAFAAELNRRLDPRVRPRTRRKSTQD